MTAASSKFKAFSPSIDVLVSKPEILVPSELIKMTSPEASSSDPRDKDLPADDNTDAPTASSNALPSSILACPGLQCVTPIGYITSCFKSKNGTPRQPSVCTYSRAKLRILKSVFTSPDHSLDGLSNFSHVWIMFVFHQNNQDKSCKAKVKPPRLDGKKVGVFASRSPHRPNPIGLTLAKLHKIEGGTLHLSGVDMIEGTPVLDVKPYVPDYDMPKPTHISNSDPLALTRQAPGLEHHVGEDVGDRGKATPEADMETMVRTTGTASCADVVASGRKRLLDPSDADESLEGDRLQTSRCSKQIKSRDEPPQSAGSQQMARNSLPLERNVTQGNADSLADRGLDASWKSSLVASSSDHASTSEGAVREQQDGSRGETGGCHDVRIADWVRAPPIAPLTVRFTPTAECQLAGMWQEPDNGQSVEFLSSYAEARQAIVDILSADPRSVYRRKACSDRLYYFPLDNLHVTSWFGQDFAEVLNIQHISLACLPDHKGRVDSSM